ncbi:MAG: GFA family protein [Rhizobiaceae bacterium]
MRIKLPLTGGCQCGQLRYKITEQPYTLYCCHCTECQAQSSSAFGMSLRVRAGAIEFDGEHGSYFRDAGNPKAVEGIFCPKCGTRVVHQGRGADAGSSVKAGTLDDKSWLNPVGHIWAASAQKWVKLEGLVYDKQPDDDYAALIEAFERIS